MLAQVTDIAEHFPFNGINLHAKDDYRDLANKFEKAFEWEDHASSEDLGVLTGEIDFDAPNPYLDRAKDATL